MSKNNDKKGYPLLVVLMAVTIVAGLSFVPWTRVSSGFFKDYDLLEDISDRQIDRGETDDIVDPRLMAEMAEADVEEFGDSIPATEEPAAAVEETVDTITGTPWEAPRRDGIVLIEDFSTDGTGLARFKAALAQSGIRQVRVGVIGDSYIEGDIFTQDVRQMLQERFGGHGPGYVPMTSEVSGFRRSVRQSDTGWVESDLRESSAPDCRWLSGQKFTGDGGASTTWKGAKKPANAGRWNSAMVVMKALSGGRVSLKADTAKRQSFTLAASDSVQAISVAGDMSKTVFTNNSTPGLTVYGAWLADSTGVVVDCMSLRGNSGIVHSALSPELTEAMRPYVDYDLIVLEYGLNAVTSKQKNYSYYKGRMSKVIDRLRQCYPSADILVMGAGDRGQKSGADYHSTGSVQSMVNTQRALAREAGVTFWDTRAAMGGNDAIVKWRADKEVNADYIHLNFDGGRHLARLFVSALLAEVDK